MGYQKIIEILFSCALTLNAVFFIPQIIKLWQTKDGESLSLLTFFGFNCVQILGILHCYFTKAYLPMLGWVISLGTCGCVTLMIIFYRCKVCNKFCCNK
jgi:MtN3 and saliva related transmembrane protein